MQEVQDFIQKVKERGELLKVAATLVGSGLADVTIHTPHGIAFSTIVAITLLSRNKNVKDVLMRYLVEPHIASEESVAFVSNATKKVVRFANNQLEKRKDNNQNFEYDEFEESSDMPKMFRLEDVIDVIDQYNSEGFIYFGRTKDGDFVLEVNDIYHFLYSGTTGSGKSNDSRFFVAQIARVAETYMINPLGSPVKKVNDERKVEVWKPVFDLLHNGHIVREKDEIKKLIIHLFIEMNKRKDLDFECIDFGGPIFCFIDESPEVLSMFENEKPNANNMTTKDMLMKILEQGRNYAIFVTMFTQSSSVGRLKLSEAAQGMFATVAYGGGGIGAIKKHIDVTKEQEATLRSTKGLKLFRAQGIIDPIFVRSPLATNEGIFEFLGMEFVLEDWYKQKTASLLYKNKQNFDGYESDTSFQFSVDTENDENVPENAHFDVLEEKLKTENYIDDPLDVAILSAFETFRQDNMNKATVNAIVRVVKRDYPGVKIVYNTDKERIKELAKLDAFEIYEGAGGARKQNE